MSEKEETELDKRVEELRAQNEELATEIGELRAQTKDLQQALK